MERSKFTWVAVAAVAAGVTLSTGSLARAADGDAESHKEGALKRFDTEMSRTGEVGDVDLRGTKGDNGIVKAGRLGERPETKVTRVEPAPTPPAAAATLALSDDVLLSHQYEGAFAAVDNCRFDVARRRVVPPSEIQAGTVTFRWLIDPSGHVHDMRAEVVSATDKDLIKCAEMVLANWALINPVEKPTVLERTHVFRKLSASDKGRPVRVGTKD